MYFVEGVRPPYGPRERGHKGGPKFGVDSRAEPSPRGRAGSGRLLISDGNQRASYHRLSLASSQARLFFFFLSSVVTVASEGQREGGGFRPANGLPSGNPSYLYSMSDWTIGTLEKSELAT